MSLWHLQRSVKRGKLYIVGIGPGSIKHMTLRALEAIRDSEVVVGYKKYVELLDRAGLLQGKRIIVSEMGQELDRVKAAIEEAMSGRVVSLVSSGDPVVYGIAELALRYLDEHNVDIDVEIVPGVTAALAASSLLGAPLSDDFAVISLSDYNVPWEQICKRLKAALETDFVVVLYNPSSRARRGRLIEALNLIKQIRPTAIVCIVKNALRDGQNVVITSIRDLDPEIIDMNTIVIVGSSRTRVLKRGFVITKRSRVLP